jgi:hypothetical protein
MWSSIVSFLEAVIKFLKKEDIKLKKLAIVVGHEDKARGANSLSPLSLSEYLYNEIIAALMVKECGMCGVDGKIFKRNGTDIAGVVRNVNAWVPDASIELHFNSTGDSSVGGTETWFVSSESEKLAQEVQRNMCVVFKRSGHGNRGAKEFALGARGRSNISGMNHPAVLVEPFFGSNAEDCKLGASLKSQYAKCLVDAFMRIV